MPRLRSQERKEKIIRSAITLFSNRGFRGTITREIARKAGISEALLFRHFPDKKKLYGALLAYKMEEQFPTLLEELSVNGSPSDILHVLAFRIADQNIKDPSFMRLLLFSALERHELSDLFFQKRTLPLLEFLKQLFRKGIHEKKLKGKDPELMARGFLALLFGFLQTRILFRIPFVLERSVKEILKTYVTIYLRGIER